jgi:hypothetical protein
MLIMTAVLKYRLARVHWLHLARRYKNMLAAAEIFVSEFTALTSLKVRA